MRRKQSMLVSGSITAGVLVALAGTASVPPVDGRPDSVELDTGKSVLGVTKESKGAVTVTLTPEKHEKGKLIVKIGVNTHTVNDLDKYDLKKIVSLSFDGQSVAPVSAPPLRGHHNSGELVFPLQTLPSSFSIQIKGLDEPALRTLSWP